MWYGHRWVTVCVVVCGDLRTGDSADAANVERKSCCVCSSVCGLADRVGGTVLALNRNSALYTALRTTVNNRGECQASAPLVVQLGSAYYEYVAPDCVHPFLSGGQFKAKGKDLTDRRCIDAHLCKATVTCCKNGWTDMLLEVVLRPKV